MSKHHTEPHPKKARLRILLPTGESFKRKVNQAESHIGRGPRNEILVLDPEVSTRHAMLTSDGSDYIITDESDEGGTLVNGERVSSPRKLADGDMIRIGQSQITFRLKHGGKAHKRHNGKNGSPVAAAVPAPNGESEEKHKKKHKEHEHDKHQAKAEGQGAAAAKAKAPSSEGKSEVKKKKTRPAKSIEDDRIRAAKVRAWGGIIATVLSVVLTVTISILVTRMGSMQSAPVAYGSPQAAKKLASPSGYSRISGGTFEASGVAAVPDAHGVLFVDDSKPDQVFYMPLNELGEQEGPVKPIPLGVSVENPEGITQLGTHFLIVGALATPESNTMGGVASFDFDPTTQTVSRAVLLTGVRKFLFDNVPELKAWTDKVSIQGGLNIEGIAVDPDPQHPRILLGLRGPLLNGNALIVPLKLRDRLAPLSLENLEMDEPNAIQLNLNGQAIRDMEYDPLLRAFLIISGAPETEKKTDFTLWTWSGEGNQTREGARPKLQTPLDKKMKPEGIAHVMIGTQDFVFIMGDASCYAKIDYLAP
ncbi:MAG TPA: DUF3616 domain-containing protein [Blastocatellia bacterium]|nr:DUF3616 domain-containing protein [Blastocatellia bacterium]